MKYLITVSFVLLILLPQGTQAQKQYRIDDPQAVAAVGQFQYTVGHYERELRFVEFLLNLELNPAEQKAGLAESLQTFREDPRGTLLTIGQVDQQMQQVYGLTDVAQIALIRSALLCQIYQAYTNAIEKPLLIQWIDEHVGILALDAQNNLAFTAGDSDAFYDLMIFLRKLNGEKVQSNRTEKEQLRTLFGQQFNHFDLETRRLFCTMSLYTPFVKSSYQALSSSDQTTFRQQIRGLNASQTETVKDQNVSPQTYSMLSEMSSQMHLSMLNAIENLGDGGGYWERRRY